MGPGPLKVATVRVVRPTSAISSVVAVVVGVGNVPATLSLSPPLVVTTVVSRSRGHSHHQRHVLSSFCRGGTRQPHPKSADSATLARADEFPMNSWRNFGESPKGEVRRIPIPRTPVNR